MNTKNWQKINYIEELITMDKNFKSGFVTLIARPNVGKSTLLNKIAGQKIAITSPVAQTTRHQIKCIYTDTSSQIILDRKSTRLNPSH